MDADNRRLMDNSSLAVGATLSHYRIVEKLGAGGMGEVYLAQDTRSGRAFQIDELPALISRPVGVDEREIREILKRWLTAGKK